MTGRCEFRELTVVWFYRVGPAVLRLVADLRKFSSAMIDHVSLRVEMARAGVSLLDLARRLAVPRSTLSAWLRNVNPAPADLRLRLAAALQVPEAVLRPPREGDWDDEA